MKINNEYYTRENIAWAAGFYEGEGTCSIYWSKDKNYPAVILSVPQVEREPLDRFNSIFGGHFRIHIRPKRSERHSDCHVLQSRKFELVQFCTSSMWHLLSVRRRGQIERAFTEYAKSSEGRAIVGVRCKRGHDVSVDSNVYIWTRPDGAKRRFCLECRAITAEERRARS